MCLTAFSGFGGAGVLSVAKRTLGQEAYYEQQVVRGLDDYYAGKGRAAGDLGGTRFCGERPVSGFPIALRTPPRSHGRRSCA